MDGTSKKNVVELVRREGSSAQVRGDEMHVWSISKSSLRRFDRSRVDVQTVIIELGKRIGDVTVRAPEVKELGGGMKLGKVELLFAFLEAQDHLNEIPDQRN